MKPFTFSIDNTKEIETIKAHQESINSIIILKDKRIVSCSKDKLIKIFNPKKQYQC